MLGFFYGVKNMANLPAANELIGNTVTESQFKAKLKIFIENVFSKDQGDLLTQNIVDLKRYIDSLAIDANKDVLSGLLNDVLGDLAAEGAGENGWVASLIADSSGENQQVINDRNKLKISTTREFGDLNLASQKILLSDVYQSLESAQLDFPFLIDLTGSYGWAVLQKQFNALQTNTWDKAVISGSVYVNKTLSYSSKAVVDWDLKLVLEGGTGNQYAIDFNNTDNSKHNGKINLVCYVTDAWNTNNWSLRSWWNGILIKRTTGSDFSGLRVTGRLKGWLWNVVGVVNNGNYTKFGFIDGTCGSRIGDFTRNILNKVNNGSENNINQTTTLTLDASIDLNVAENTVVIGGEEHLIISNTGTTIVVTPWVASTDTVANIIYGGIAKSSGDNSNNIRFKQLRGFESACTYAFDTAMGTVIEDFGAEYNTIGVQVGLKPNSQILTPKIDQWYSEHNTTDILDVRLGQVPTPDQFMKITSAVGLTNANWTSRKVKLAPKNSAGEKDITRAALPVDINGKAVDVYKDSISGVTIANPYIYFGMREKIDIFGQDQSSITLAIDTTKLHSLGFNTLEINHIGTKHNGGSDKLTLVCEVPYTFENANEANGRYRYLSKTDRPRRLLIVLQGTVFKVYELNTTANVLLSDLGPNLRNGEYYVNSATLNRGTNPPGTGLVKSISISHDVYIDTSVEESYEVVGNLPVKKIRTKSGANATGWTPLPTEQLNSVTSLLSTATLAEVITAFNLLIADLKSKKYMKS